MRENDWLRTCTWNTNYCSFLPEIVYRYYDSCNDGKFAEIPVRGIFEIIQHSIVKVYLKIIQEIRKYIREFYKQPEKGYRGLLRSLRSLSIW